MARPLRVEFEGALYHLTGRGNARQRIFADDKDCARFVELVVQSLERYDVAFHAYVLMGNHYHMIAETRRANLGRWMHWLTTAYTVYFNRRHRLVGHLFQGRHFLQRLKDHLDRKGQTQHREVPALRRLRRGPDAQTILSRVARAYDCSKKEAGRAGSKRQ